MAWKEEIKLTFLMLFEDPLSKYLIFKGNFLCAMATLGNLAKLKRGLGLAFDAHFLHGLFVKMFLT